ncbi:hypothetical protein JCM8547_002144 [Rhodosporidiobolus lusitaniae]
MPITLDPDPPPSPPLPAATPFPTAPPSPAQQPSRPLQRRYAIGPQPIEGFMTPSLDDPRWVTVHRPRSDLLSSSNPPPSVPFDAPQDDTANAWGHWLAERRQRREALAAASASFASNTATRQARLVQQAQLLSTRSVAERQTERVELLRQQAERLPRIEPDGGVLLQVDGVGAAASSLQASLDNSRRTLEQVRRRLDETRERIITSTSRVEANADVVLARTAEERASADRLLQESRERLDWSTTFVTRIDSLIETLSSITDRTASLSSNTNNAVSSPTSASFASLSVSPPSPVASASFFETPSGAAATNSLRQTVRTIVTASRHVSAAIDRHRESVAAASARLHTPAGNDPLSTGVAEDVPLLRPDDTLPTQGTSSPSAIPGITLSNLDPSSLLATGSSFPLSTSPLPLSPSPEPHSSTAEPPENYPGERRQLARIAQLQSDIAQRASQLRDLRGRADELVREQESFDLSVSVESGGRGAGDGGGEGEEPKDDAAELEAEREVLDWAQRRALRRAEETASAAREALGSLGKVRKERTEEERRRDYEVWARCGR